MVGSSSIDVLGIGAQHLVKLLCPSFFLLIPDSVYHIISLLF